MYARRSPDAARAAADGSRVYVANWESNTVSVIDVARLKVEREIAVDDGPRAFGLFLRPAAAP